MFRLRRPTFTNGVEDQQENKDEEATTNGNEKNVNADVAVDYDAAVAHADNSAVIDKSGECCSPDDIDDESLSVVSKTFLNAEYEGEPEAITSSNIVHDSFGADDGLSTNEATKVDHHELDHIQTDDLLCKPEQQQYISATTLENRFLTTDDDDEATDKLLPPEHDFNLSSQNLPESVGDAETDNVNRVPAFAARCATDGEVEQFEDRDQETNVVTNDLNESKMYQEPTVDKDDTSDTMPLENGFAVCGAENQEDANQYQLPGETQHAADDKVNAFHGYGESQEIAADAPDQMLEDELGNLDHHEATDDANTSTENANMSISDTSITEGIIADKEQQHHEQNDDLKADAAALSGDEDMLSCLLDINEFPSDIIDEQLLRNDIMVFDDSTAAGCFLNADDNVESTVRQLLDDLMFSICGAPPEALLVPAVIANAKRTSRQQQRQHATRHQPKFMTGGLFVVDGDDAALVAVVKRYARFAKSQDKRRAPSFLYFQSSKFAVDISAVITESDAKVSVSAVICHSMRPAPVILWALSQGVPIIHSLPLTFLTPDSGGGGDDESFRKALAQSSISDWLWGTRPSESLLCAADSTKVGDTFQQYFDTLYAGYTDETLEIAASSRVLHESATGGRFAKWQAIFDNSLSSTTNTKELILLQTICAAGGASMCEFNSMQNLVQQLLLASNFLLAGQQQQASVVMLVVDEEQLARWPACDVDMLRWLVQQQNQHYHDECDSENSETVEEEEEKHRLQRPFRCDMFIVVKPSFITAFLYRAIEPHYDDAADFVREKWAVFCPLSFAEVLLLPTPTPPPLTTGYEANSSLLNLDDAIKPVEGEKKFSFSSIENILDLLVLKKRDAAAGQHCRLAKSCIIDRLCSSEISVDEFCSFCNLLTDFVLHHADQYQADTLVDYLICYGRVVTVVPDAADAEVQQNAEVATVTSARVFNEPSRFNAAVSLAWGLLHAISGRHRQRYKSRANADENSKLAHCVYMWQCLMLPHSILRRRLQPHEVPAVVAGWDKLVVNVATVMFSSSLELLLASSSYSQLQSMQATTTTNKTRTSNLNRFCVHMQVMCASATLIILLPQQQLPSEKLRHLSLRCCSVLNLALSPSAAAAAGMSCVDLIHFLHSIECDDFRIALCTGLLATRSAQQQQQAGQSAGNAIFSVNAAESFISFSVMLEKLFASLYCRWQWPTASALQQHLVAELKAKRVALVPSVLGVTKKPEIKTASAEHEPSPWLTMHRNIVAATANNSIVNKDQQQAKKETIVAYNEHVAALHRQDYVLFMTILAHVLHDKDSFTTSTTVTSFVPIGKNTSTNVTSQPDQKKLKLEVDENDNDNVAANDASIALKPWTGKKQRRTKASKKPTMMEETKTIVKITGVSYRSPLSSPQLRALLGSVDENCNSLLHHLLKCVSYSGPPPPSQLFSKACQVAEFLLTNYSLADSLDIYNKSILFYAVQQQQQQQHHAAAKGARELLAVILKHIPDALLDIEATDCRASSWPSGSSILEISQTRRNIQVQHMLIARQLQCSSNGSNSCVDSAACSLPREDLCRDVCVALSLVQACLSVSEDVMDQEHFSIYSLVRRFHLAISRPNTLRFCSWNLAEHVFLQCVFCLFFIQPRHHS